MSKNTFETVAYIHIQNKKLLLVKPKSKDAFYMPGGKLEQNENNIQALIREVKEEIGVDLISETIKHYGIFEGQAYGKEEGINVRIICYIAKHKGKPLSNTEIEKIDFFTHADYHSMPKTAPAVRLLFEDLKKKGLID